MALQSSSPQRHLLSRLLNRSVRHRLRGVPAIAPLLLSVVIPAFVVGGTASPANGRATHQERIVRLLACIDQFGAQPNNAVLDACVAYAAGRTTLRTSTFTAPSSQPIASRPPATMPAAETKPPSPQSSPSPPPTKPPSPQPSPLSPPTAVTPPRAQSFGASPTPMASPAPVASPAASASTPVASASTPAASASTSAAAAPSDRQQAILGCLTSYGTDTGNRALGECGAWQPNASPAAASPDVSPPASNSGWLPGGIDGGNGSTQGGDRIARASAGGGFGGTGTGGSPRRSLSDPGQSSPGGSGSAGRTTPAIGRQGAGNGSSGDSGNSGNSSSSSAGDAGPTPAASPSETPSWTDDGDELTLEDVGISSASNALERGRVPDNFDDDRLVDFICQNITRSFSRCEARSNGGDGGDGGTGDGDDGAGQGTGVSRLGDTLALSCQESEATLRARGVTRITQGQTSFYVGFAQVSANNQDPRIARFDNGQQVWCREDYAITRDDSRGYGLVWDGGDRLYAAFTVNGTRGSANQDFRRFATNGWLTSYGAGGGPAVTVLTQISPTTGDVQRATFISALQSNGASNTLILTELTLGANSVNIRAQSSFSPRRPDRSAFNCSNVGVGRLDYTARFTPDLSTVTQANAPACS